jgi:hypothetical protein
LVLLNDFGCQEKANRRWCDRLAATSGKEQLLVGKGTEEHFYQSAEISIAPMEQQAGIENGSHAVNTPRLSLILGLQRK